MGDVTDVHRNARPSPKVYDCFTFFNELEILALRLQSHDDHVDYFVIVEATQTFTGHPKPLCFAEHRERFSAYSAKIIHVVIDDLPLADDPFEREHHQRNAIVRGLGDAAADDLIIISDVDELLRPHAIEAARGFDGYTVFNMPMYQFYLNFEVWRTGWTAAYAFTYGLFSRIAELSKSRWDRSSFEADFRAEDKYQTVGDAGWHFTHLGGIDRLQHKFRSYSHSNDPWPTAMMREGALRRHIVSGGIVGNFRDRGRFVTIDETYPPDIVARQTEYAALGFIKDPYEALDELQEGYRALLHSYATRLHHDDRPQDMLFGTRPAEFMAMADLRPPFAHWNDPAIAFGGTLVSVGKPATQSSVSPWSRSQRFEEEAAGAVNGRKTGDVGFHTNLDDRPWWMVDLEQDHLVKGVRIYNRLYPLEVAARASNLRIEMGSCPQSMVFVLKRTARSVIGGIDGNPLDLVLDEPMIARFVRISLPGRDYLHLDEVEIYSL